VNAVTTLLVFLLGRRLMGRYSALAAAASFAFLSVGQPVLGPFAHATHFVILFAAAGALALLKAIETDRRAWLITSGALFGLALLMKQHGAFFALFAVAYLAWHQYRVELGSLRRFVLRAGMLLLGVAVPLAVTVVVLARAGVLGRFWFWTFTYASKYVTQVPLPAGLGIFLSKLGAIAGASALLWTMAAVGLIGVWRNDHRRGSRTFLLGFLLASFLAMVPGLYFRQHYFILALPAVALLAGVALDWVKKLLLKGQHSAAGVIVPLSMFVIAFGGAVLQQEFFLFERRPEDVSRATYGRNPFSESVEIAAYIKANTDEADRIAVLGSEPQIYFYANRLSATGHIYMYGLMEPHSYAEQMQREMIDEVERARPKFLVQVAVPESWLRQPGSAQVVFEWMPRYVKENFDLVGVAEIPSSGTTRYYWEAQAAGYTLRSQPAVLLYKRKGIAGAAD